MFPLQGPDRKLCYAMRRTADHRGSVGRLTARRAPIILSRASTSYRPVHYREALGLNID